MEEKLFVLTETQLANLLFHQMENIMNARDGVDNWEWYGHAREDVLADFWPDGEVPEWAGLWECAEARIEAGEFQELVTFDI